MLKFFKIKQNSNLRSIITDLEKYILEDTKIDNINLISNIKIFEYISLRINFFYLNCWIVKYNLEKTNINVNLKI